MLSPGRSRSPGESPGVCVCVYVMYYISTVVVLYNNIISQKHNERERLYKEKVENR